MKKLLLGALIAAITAPALADNYYVVVPSKGRLEAVAGIAVALNSGTPPIAAVGTPYAYDFSKNLVVTGDPKFAGAGVTWALTQGTLPAGLTLDPKTGVVQGTPAAVGSAAVSLQATYKTKTGAQQYVVTIGQAKFSVTGTAVTDNAFPDTVVNTTAQKTVVFDVANTGNLPGAMPLSALGGANPADFSAATTCAPANVQVNGTCKVTVGFKPTAVGARAASLALAGTTYNFTGMGTPANADPYFANVSLLMHMDGANGGTSFPDVKGSTFKSNGNIITTTSAGKFGGALSSPVNGGAYLAGTANGALAFGTADFTVEMWLFFSSTVTGYHQWVISSVAGPTGFHIQRWYTNGTLIYGAYAGVNATSATSPSLNAWHHIAVSRNSGVTRLYIDNKLDSQFNDTNNYTDSNVIVGGLVSPAGRELSGMLDELRVTKGVGRYPNGVPAQTKEWPDY